MPSYIKKRQRGFTIIELLISLSIITIITTAVAVKFSSFSGSSSLSSEAEELVSVLRRAQLWSLTGQTRNGERPAGGWGVHIEICNAGSCTYTFFADTDPVNPPNYVYTPGFDEEIITYTLSQEIGIDLLEPGFPLDIIFSPPNADVYLNGSQAGAKAVIRFLQESSSETTSVELDPVSGRLNIVF